MNEKTNKNYWLRLTPLYWLISLLYICLQTLDFPNTQDGLVEFVLSSILCVVSAIFYEKKIGKINITLHLPGLEKHKVELRLQM